MFRRFDFNFFLNQNDLDILILIRINRYFLLIQYHGKENSKKLLFLIIFGF